jgi:hypothetical protein
MSYTFIYTVIFNCHYQNREKKYEEAFKLLLVEGPETLSPWWTDVNHIHSDDVIDNYNEVETFRLLFIWALLTGRWKLAKVLWAYAPQPVAAALVAGLVLRKMARLLKSDYTLEAKRQILRWQRRCINIFS